MGTGKVWLRGHAARRMVEIVKVIKDKFPKGSNFNVEALKKESNADWDTAKKALKYVMARGHVEGRIVARNVTFTQYYHDPDGKMTDFHCSKCEKPVIIDSGSTAICPSCKEAIYSMCRNCGEVLDISALDSIDVLCPRCGSLCQVTAAAPKTLAWVPLLVPLLVGGGLVIIACCSKIKD